MKDLQKLALLPMMLLLTGCLGLKGLSTTGTTSQAKPPICNVGWFEPITFSVKNDTRETILQIDKFNSGRDSYCQ